jgi:putative transposase
MAARRVERPLPSRTNEVWAMDFVSDALFDGKRFRALTVVDAYTRECLAIHVDQGIKGEQVVDVMDRLLFERGSPPAKIRVDNGPEFISRALDHWAYINRVTLDFSRPGKPTDNAFVESFNGRLRDECLNTHWFLSLDDARSKVEAWRTDFNQPQPHTSLRFMTPADEPPDLSFWPVAELEQGHRSNYRDCAFTSKIRQASPSQPALARTRDDKFHRTHW